MDALLHSARPDRTNNERPLRCDDEGRLLLVDYKTAVARGLVAGAGFFRQIGRNPDVDDIREDCWESGGDYVFPPAGGIQMRIVSTDNVNDKAGGTGALSVDIHYLDATGSEQHTTVTMNGATQVLTTPTNIWRVQDFHVKTAGSTGAAVGTISLTNTAGSVVYSTISPSSGRQRQAVWTVPFGKVAFVDEIIISGNATGGGAPDYTEGYLRATCDFDGELLPSGVFNFKSGVIQTNAAEWVTMANPVKLPALADVKMSAKSRSATSSVVVVAGFAGWYEDA